MRRLGTAARLAAGAIGEPGRRRFYLRVGTGDDDVWFPLEKGQVRALAERCLEVLRPAMPEPVGDAQLGVPVSEDFTVGDITLAISDTLFDFVLHPLEEGDEPVEFSAPAGMVRSMAEEALRVVAAGRPLCPYCNLPIDPDGHLCPASNGDRRRAR